MQRLKCGWTTGRTPWFFVVSEDHCHQDAGAGSEDAGIDILEHAISASGRLRGLNQKKEPLSRKLQAGE